jgi:Flp pilus assembly protein TadG
MADARDACARPSADRTGPGPLLRRFLKARDGAAAVEMSLVAMPFFMLLFGVIELALIFLVSSSLENATAQAARTIRTGAFQNGAAPTAAAFKASICNNLGWMQSDCTSNLFVDVRTFSSFSSISTPQPVTGGVFNSSSLTCNPGGPGDIVVVRAYYQWPLIAPLMSQALQQLNSGKTLITSTATFRNEPYTANGAPAAC